MVIDMGAMLLWSVVGQEAAPGGPAVKTLVGIDVSHIEVVGIVGGYPHRHGALEWGLIVLAVISFGLVAIVQAMFPLWTYHPAAAGLRVHLSNGFYANAVFDRLVGGWTAKTLS